MPELFITEKLKKEALEVTKDTKKPTVTNGPSITKNPSAPAAKTPTPTPSPALNTEGKLEQLLDDIEEAHSSVSEAYTALSAASVRITQIGAASNERDVKTLQTMKSQLSKILDDLIALQINLG